MPAISDLKVITNNVPRDVVDAYELTAEERAEFDYIDWPAIDRGEDSASFIRYRGELYDLSEFERWDNPDSLTRHGWDGIRSVGFVLLRPRDPLLRRLRARCRRPLLHLMRLLPFVAFFALNLFLVLYG